MTSNRDAAVSINWGDGGTTHAVHTREDLKALTDNYRVE